MKTPVQLTERIYYKVFFAVVGSLVLLGVLGWAGMRIFHDWQERHFVRRAAGFLAGGDTRTASLTARRAFQLNPENADAARMLAEIGQRAGDGTELEWRRKVVELRPDSVEDALALVRCALRANDLSTAEKTLQGVGDAARQTAAYHAALGRLAEMRNKKAEAEIHWVKAAELAPDDAAYQLQLAMLQLGSTDEAKRTAARAALERLRADQQHRAAATRALIVDGAARREDPQRLLALAAELQSYPAAAFGDRIIYLEILRQLRDAEYSGYLAHLEKDAAADAASAAGLLSWMSTHVGAAEAVRYAESLRGEVATTWPVPLAAAEAYAKAKDWAGLQRATAEAKWGGFEFLRHAYLARAYRGEKQEIAADQEWARAQKAASAHPQTLLILARTISTWDWQKETVELLWSLSKAPETRREALQLLYQNYAASGDTAGLYRVLVRSAEIAPDDLMVQNNLAQVSLLLDADRERARKLAEEVVRKEPNNAAYVSTYAFSLYVRGDVDAALEAFLGLSDEQLKTPSIAAYYGIVLAAAGEKEKARPYLELGARAFLLPEEKALLTKAENAIR